MHGLMLKSQADWKSYCKSGDKPDNIPAQPWKVYAGKGWVGLGDWLGTAVLATHLRRHRPFKKARAYVRELGLKSVAKWLVYASQVRSPTTSPPIRRTYTRRWVGPQWEIGSGPAGLLIGIERTAPSRKREQCASLG